MCRVNFEGDLWSRWERRFQKSSSRASHASERNFWLERLQDSPPLLIPLQSHSSVPNTAHLCFGSLWNKCIMWVDLAKRQRALYGISARAQSAGTVGVKKKTPLRLKRSFILSQHSLRKKFYIFHPDVQFLQEYQSFSAGTPWLDWPHRCLQAKMGKPTGHAGDPLKTWRL